MKQLTLQAKATATDLGEFTAIAAAYSVDRGGDRIIPGAFSATIEKWQASGKQIPLHWDHEGGPESIIGTVDPAKVKETDAGLMVAGRLDLENSEVAKEAWRAMKSNSMALSFGYMVVDGAEAEDGVYELKSIDLFEISVTPSPMNADTRFLDLKSAHENEVKALTERVEALEQKLADQPAEEETEEVEDVRAPLEASDPEADQYLIEMLNASL